MEGVNTRFDYYAVSLAGELGGDLWTLNLSPLPGEQKRMLTITAATTFLLNYAAQSYPSKIDIVSQQIPGSINEEGLNTFVIATLVPGTATPVYNSGNVIGYNITYNLLGAPKSWEIGTIPSIVFNATIGRDRTPVEYPLVEDIALELQITRVSF